MHIDTIHPTRTLDRVFFMSIMSLYSQYNNHSMKALWQQILIDCITNPVDLLQQLDLQDAFPKLRQTALSHFACRVPQPYIQRIRKGDPHDPLLKQVLPINQELEPVTGFYTDPLQEQNSTPTQGLLHKYQGRVLLTLTGACAINCRYCFRRHFPYSDHQFNKKRWLDIVHYIQQDPSIHEVIFSGGDPLMLKDTVLKDLVNQLESIHHIQTLRIHTRLPIVIPQRITPEFTQLLETTRLNTVIVTHINHANEIDTAVSEALLRIPLPTHLLNQSVLLKGVNDSPEVLIDLSHTLFANRILPYYCHLLDKVQGAAHFNVDEARACVLLKQVRDALPGYLVPTLAREEPQKKAKTAIL